MSTVYQGFRKSVEQAMETGFGSFASPLLLTTAGARFMECYTANSAASGSSKGLYWGHHVTTAGGSGGGGDFYAWANAVAAANIGGLQGAAYFTSGGSITGLGCGVNAILEIPDAALPAGGTYTAGRSVISAKGASSDISAATRHSIHRFELDGDATGKATASVVLEFAGLTSGTGATDMVKTDKHAGTSTDGLRCIVNGDVKYIMLVD